MVFTYSTTSMMTTAIQLQTTNLLLTKSKFLCVIKRECNSLDGIEGMNYHTSLMNTHLKPIMTNYDELTHAE